MKISKILPLAVVASMLIAGCAHQASKVQIEGSRAISSDPSIDSNDATPFGNMLAASVAAELRRRALVFNHRDYCGMGLEFDATHGVFYYGEVFDGEVRRTGAQSFNSEAAFTTWLAGQSNLSLSRSTDSDFSRYNQVITRDRLKMFNSTSN